MRSNATFVYYGLLLIFFNKESMKLQIHELMIFIIDDTVNHLIVYGVLLFTGIHTVINYVRISVIARRP